MSTRGWTRAGSNPAPIRPGAVIPTVETMHEVINALIIAAVVVLVIVRRFTARRLDGRRPYVIPIVLVAIAVAQGHPIDPHHAVVSTGLLAGEIVAALLLGLGLGATMRVWREPDGSTWSRGTWATFGVFLLSIAVRGGLMAVGYAVGIKAGSGEAMLTVAAWVLTQNAVLLWRARTLPAPARVSVHP